MPDTVPTPTPYDPEHESGTPMCGGGWISGPMIGGPAEDLVATAIKHLRDFGARDRLRAGRLLLSWTRHDELSADQVTQVLAAFPPPWPTNTTRQRDES